MHGGAIRDCGATLGVLRSARVRGSEDNVHVASFFHSLKAELTRGVLFATRHDVHRSLMRYMQYDNDKRLHAAPGYHPLLPSRDV